MASFLFSWLNTKSVFAVYTLSLSTDTSAISLDVNPAVSDVSIKNQELTVTSNCRSGYNLSIATPSGSTLYENGDSTKTATFTAVDGTHALNNSANNNKWGYTLTNNPTSSTVFSALSSTAINIKTPSETASATDINDAVPIYYGVKADNSVAPGSYQMTSSGSIVYYLTMDVSCANYTITYNANGGTNNDTNGSNTYTQEIAVGESAKLTNNNFKAPTTGSYTDAGNNTITGDNDKLWLFWGWNTNINGTGDWYKDQEEVTNLALANSNITLYAQWKQATLSDMTAGTQVGTEKVIDHNLMQDMRPETCYNSPITTAANAPAATLLDYRGKVTTGDNPELPEQYNVSKLPDGLCWMTTNLNLGRASGGPNGDGTITLTSDDTDLSNNTTFTLPAGDTTSYTSTTRLAKVRLTNNSGTNANGAYYTWSASVANTSSTSGSPTTSICPKNWDLPSSTQYTNLKTKAGYKTGNLTTAAPSSFLINGGFTNGATFYRATYGWYWTNTSSSTTLAFGARVGSTAINTYAASGTGASGGGNKYYRKNIRCIASQGTVTINYDGNGADDGSVASQTNVEINSATNIQPGTGFTKAGWYFTGWNTAANGTGTAIAADASIATLGIKPGDTITLYAQWLPQYTITYINNCMTYVGASSGCDQTVSSYTIEQKINLTSNPSTGTETGTLADYNNISTWNLTGWKIKGWSTVADNSSNANTEYGANATYTVPSGSVAGDGITLYAHWVPVYTVQYDGNGSDNDSTGMGSTDSSTGLKSVRHTNVAEGNTFDLFASNFKRAGYGFVGWSTDANAWSKLTDNDTTNDAIIWGPNEMITAPAYNGTPITTLYAVWAPAETSGGNPVYLQSWTGCSTMTATTYNSTTGTLTVAKNSVTALTDQRDNEVYAIAKLADGNCWMIENLRLADTHQESGNTVATTLSTTNTNILSSNNTLPITNIYNADSSLATKSNSLSPSSSDAYNATNAPYGWCTTDSVACDSQSRLNTANTTTNATPSQTQNITSINAHTDLNTTIYAYGNYYNWYSATAGYGAYGSSGVTDGDLCPAGWHLPYGGNGTGTKGGNTSGGFYYLASSMSATATNSIVNSNKFRTFPNNIIYPGAVDGSTVGGNSNSRGSYGYYWTSTAYSNDHAYVFSIEPSSTGTGSMFMRYGDSVRCIASPAS
ncbi:InlB B-repeat-containing protein [Candidatus Saccharibacteria bacterium]|nr:InlB B-repeat-containing protein [Candidatus Saccharibacteria bacterium]